MEALFVILAIVGVTVGAAVLFGLFKSTPKSTYNGPIRTSPNPGHPGTLEPVEPGEEPPIKTLPPDLELEPLEIPVQNQPKQQSKKKRKPYKPRKPKTQQ